MSDKGQGWGEGSEGHLLEWAEKSQNHEVQKTFKNHPKWFNTLILQQLDTMYTSIEVLFKG